MAELSLGQKQRLFARLLGALLTHIYFLGHEVSLADGNVDPLRKGVHVDPDGHPFGAVLRFQDRVHMNGSLHYSRLAQDLNLFVGGVYITDGNHPVWKELGEWWEQQNPLCRWGGRFSDANHFSVTHDGRQ